MAKVQYLVTPCNKHELTTGQKYVSLYRLLIWRLEFAKAWGSDMGRQMCQSLNLLPVVNSSTSVLGFGFVARNPASDTWIYH